MRIEDADLAWDDHKVPFEYRLTIVIRCWNIIAPEGDIGDWPPEVLYHPTRLALVTVDEHKAVQRDLTRECWRRLGWFPKSEPGVVMCDIATLYARCADWGTDGDGRFAGELCEVYQGGYQSSMWWVVTPKVQEGMRKKRKGTIGEDPEQPGKITEKVLGNETRNRAETRYFGPSDDEVACLI